MENIGKELVDRFALNYSGDALIDYEYAKQCALICVDEILRELHHHDPHNEAGDCTQGIIESKNYWQEVKQEIENL